MAWIESHEEIGDHQKTQNLALQLNCSIPTAVGHLHLLWHYTLKVAWEKGDLSLLPKESIARACWYAGDPQTFIDAMQRVGFMDDMKIHDWKIYAKHIIYQRKYNKARRKNNRKFTAVKQQDYIAKSTATIPDLTTPKEYIYATSKFKKPTPAEVTEYAKSIGFELDGQKFCDFYESKGWKIGKTPMKSWLAAVRTWKSNDAGRADPPPLKDSMPAWMSQ